MRVISGNNNREYYVDLSFLFFSFFSFEFWVHPSSRNDTNVLDLRKDAEFMRISEAVV